MKTNSEIRKETKALMSGNWSAMVPVSLVFGVIYILTSKSFPLVLLVYCPLILGLAMMMLRFVRNNKGVVVRDLFYAFSSPLYRKSMRLGVQMFAYTFLWSLLFIVPGIVKFYSYLLAPYILADNPEITAEEAINRSEKLMDGHKKQLFLMSLGYLGLTLLSALLLFIPLLWLMPYYNAVYAKFYEEVKNS